MCQLIRIQLIRIQHKEHVRADNSMISTEDGNTEKQVILKLLQTFMKDLGSSKEQKRKRIIE